MDKRKRKKKIESLKKQRDKHAKKIEMYEGKNYSLIDYWKKEIKDFEEEIKEEEKKLEDS